MTAIARFKGGPLDGQEKAVERLFPTYRVPVMRRPTPEDEPIFAARRRAQMAWAMGNYDVAVPPDPTMGDVHYALTGVDGAVGVYSLKSKPDWWA